MNLFNEYELMCAKTAIYPEEVAAPYLALGLCSEAAELNFATNHEFDKELGDCQWYICRLANQYNYNFNDIVVDASYITSTLYDATVELDYFVQKLSTEAGIIAGYVKKQLRDGKNWTGEEREEYRRKIKSALVKCVSVSIYLARVRKVGYDTILKKNSEKLLSRQARGKLSGSGDNR